MCSKIKWMLIYRFLQHHIGSRLHQVLPTWEYLSPRSSLKRGWALTFSLSIYTGGSNRSLLWGGLSLLAVEWGRQRAHKTSQHRGDEVSQQPGGRERRSSFPSLVWRVMATMALFLLPTFWPFRCSSAPPAEGGQGKAGKGKLAFTHLRCWSLTFTPYKKLLGRVIGPFKVVFSNLLVYQENLYCTLLQRHQAFLSNLPSNSIRDFFLKVTRLKCCISLRELKLTLIFLCS